MGHGGQAGAAWDEGVVSEKPLGWRKMRNGWMGSVGEREQWAGGTQREAYDEVYLGQRG